MVVGVLLIFFILFIGGVLVVIDKIGVIDMFICNVINLCKGWVFFFIIFICLMFFIFGIIGIIVNFVIVFILIGVMIVCKLKLDVIFGVFFIYFGIYVGWNVLLISL